MLDFALFLVPNPRFQLSLAGVLVFPLTRLAMNSQLPKAGHRASRTPATVRTACFLGPGEANQ
jgi:hypothetical protein